MTELTYADCRALRDEAIKPYPYATSSGVTLALIRAGYAAGIAQERARLLPVLTELLRAIEASK